MLILLLRITCLQPTELLNTTNSFPQLQHKLLLLILTALVDLRLRIGGRRTYRNLSC
jgi:hypothetical protein